MTVSAGSRGCPERILRSLPVLIATLIALVQITTYGGLFFPDTVQFLRTSSLAGMVHSRPYFSVVPPLYPMLLDVVQILAPPPARMYLLILLQQASVVASVWLVLHSGDYFGRPRVFWVAALLSSLYVPLGLFAQSAQTESIFVFLCLLAIYFVARAWALGSLRWWFFAGATAGLAMGQRTVGVALPAAVLMAAWLAHWPATTLVERAWQRLKMAMAFSAGVVAVVSVFVGWNYARFHDAALVRGTGVHLFGRVAQVERTAPDTAAVRLLWEVARESGRDTIFFDTAGWALSIDLFERRRLDFAQADAILRRAALDTFFSDPLRTARLSMTAMRHMVRRVDPTWEHFWGGVHPDTHAHFLKTVIGPWLRWEAAFRGMEAQLPGYPPPAHLGLWVFGVFDDWMRVTQWLTKGPATLLALAIGAMLGAWRRDFPLLLFAGVPTAMLLVASIGDGPVARYWEVVVPEFFVMIVLTVAVSYEWWRRPRLESPRQASS